MADEDDESRWNFKCSCHHRYTFIQLSVFDIFNEQKQDLLHHCLWSSIDQSQLKYSKIKKPFNKMTRRSNSISMEFESFVFLPVLVNEHLIIIDTDIIRKSRRKKNKMIVERRKIQGMIGEKSKEDEEKSNCIVISVKQAYTKQTEEEENVQLKSFVFFFHKTEQQIALH